MGSDELLNDGCDEEDNGHHSMNNGTLVHGQEDSYENVNDVVMSCTNDDDVHDNNEVDDCMMIMIERCSMTTIVIIIDN